MDPVGPSTDADNEVEQATRVISRQQDREPRRNYRQNRKDSENDQQNEVGNREDPFHDREPTVQIPLSVLWLRFFTIGPMEWVWRSLTYMKRQPMRRTVHSKPGIQEP